jgi:hypothetical protein
LAISQIVVSGEEVIEQSHVIIPSIGRLLDVSKHNKMVQSNGEKKRRRKRLRVVQKLIKEGKLKPKVRPDLLKSWETTISKSFWLNKPWQPIHPR